MTSTACFLDGIINESALPSGAYDKWVSTRPFFPEARDFYLKIALAGGGSALVLEPGGRVTASHLAANGVETVPACRFLGGFAQDEENPDAPGQFEVDRGGEGSFPVAIAPMGGIELIWREEEMTELFGAVRRKLALGGVFVFDLRAWEVDSPNRADGLVRLAADERAADGSATVIWETWRGSAVLGGVVELGLGIESVAPDGAVKERSFGRLLLAKLDSAQIRSLAEREGFSVEGAFGGFNFEAMGRGPGIQIWILRKASERPAA